MQGIFVGCVYLTYLGLGVVAPFIMLLGYFWVDFFRPQDVAPAVLGGLPVSSVIGIAAVAVYLLKDRRDPPRIGGRIILIILFAFWMTTTLLWAVVPGPALVKWHSAFPAVIFAAVVPFFIRSRIQMEAAILTILAALSGTIMAVAAKTLVAGGHYGANLMLADTVGTGESSTLAMLSIVAMSLAGFVRRRTVIIPWFKNVIYCGFSGCCILAALGLYARTGLVCLVAFVLLTWVRSKHKLLSAVVVCICIIAITPFVADIPGSAWGERMSTIEDPMAEGSAAQRIAVWKWTLEYISEHPLGGSFNVYFIDSFILPMPNGEILKIHGRAFHSIFFEILGETGIIGLFIWSCLSGVFFLSMLRLWHQTRSEEGSEWLSDLAATLMITVIIYLAGGAFIGVGFQPLFYDLIAISVTATEYWRRSTTSVPKKVVYGQPASYRSP